jgi:drug/metabolite transporter (DMT)-like permease
VANIFLTLCGCILIARPPFLFGRMDALPLPEDGSVYDNAFWGAVAALCGTLFAANVYVVIRSLKVRRANIMEHTFIQLVPAKLRTFSFSRPKRDSISR